MWLPEDTNWALALHELERQEAAATCEGCGQPKSVCRAIEHQFDWRPEFEICHATYAIRAEQARHRDEEDEAFTAAQMWSAYLRH